MCEQPRPVFSEPYGSSLLRKLCNLYTKVKIMATIRGPELGLSSMNARFLRCHHTDLQYTKHTGTIDTFDRMADCTVSKCKWYQERTGQALRYPRIHDFVDAIRGVGCVFSEVYILSLSVPPLRHSSHDGANMLSEAHRLSHIVRLVALLLEWRIAWMVVFERWLHVA